MPRIPLLSGSEMMKFVAHYGAVKVRSKGSHRSFVRKTSVKNHVIIIPDHKELKIGTTLSILRQAGLTVVELIEYSRGENKN